MNCSLMERATMPIWKRLTRSFLPFVLFCNSLNHLRTWAVDTQLVYEKEGKGVVTALPALLCRCPSFFQ